MSAGLDSLLDAGRRAECAKHDAAYGITVPTVVHVSGRHLSQAPNDAFTREFDVDGTRYSMAQMLDANKDDEDFCEWVKQAQPGEWYPALVACQCLAAGDLSEADLISIDRACEAAKVSDPYGQRRADAAIDHQQHMLRCFGRLPK